MIKDIILTAAYLLLFGTVVINGTYSKRILGTTPLMYYNPIINLVLSVCFILWIALDVYLIFFYNWKMFIALFIIGMIFGKPLFYISREIILMPVAHFIYRDKHDA